MMDEHTSCETANEILDAAQRMLYKAGFNAFSYKDISEQVGIKTSSIHYHFPTKADLAVALAKRWRQGFNAVLADIDAKASTPSEKLRAVLRSFDQKFREGHSICPCSMLSSDFANIPEAAREEVRGSWSDAERWLAAVIEEGRRSGEFRFEGEAESTALSIFAAIEGATISASTFQDEKRLTTVTRWVYEGLAA